MNIQICVGSSCHLKGSQQIIELLQRMIEQNEICADITLSGRFCAGKCNREGVTVIVDDDVYTGVIEEGFHEFFAEKVLGKLKGV